MTLRLRACLALTVALAAAGCGAGTGVRDEGPLVSPEQAAEEGVGTQSVTVYFVRYGVITPLGRMVKSQTTDGVVRETLRKLLDGPTAAEKAVTALPHGTRLIQLRIDPFADETTVDLAGQFPSDDALISDPDRLLVRQRQFALAQVVRTLKDFPQLPPVRVRVNGLDLSLPDVASDAFNDDPLTQDSFAGILTPSDGPQSCKGEQPKAPARADVLLTHVTVVGRKLRFSGRDTTRKGSLSVEVLQQDSGDQVRQPIDLNRPTSSGSVPCPRFSGELEIPYGVTGQITLRAVVSKPNDAGSAISDQASVATGLPSVP